MSSIPVALCGKNPDLASGFVDTMVAPYKVVCVFHTTDAVREELPGLLRGENVKPSSKLGHNAHAEKVEAPKAIIVGAGYSQTELEEMRKYEMADTIPWLYPGAWGMASTMASTALTSKSFMDTIVERAVKMFDQHGFTEGKMKPEVYRF